MSKSISYLKFRTVLEQEIRTFWHLLVALEYAERWLGQTNPVRLTQQPGDNRNPFRSINISPEEFISEQGQVAAYTRESALVSFVTAFEAYLAELLERLIYLSPSLVADSDIKLSAQELSGSLVSAFDTKRWLAAKVADKYLRNKTHAEMIKRLDTFCKAGVATALSNEIDEWCRWSLVRNSIVHTARHVTPELSRAWPSRFPISGAPILLADSELARIAQLAMKIAAAIDTRAVSTIIQKQDQLLLARELFVHKGIDQQTALKAAIGKIVTVVVTKVDVEKAVAAQRRGTHEDLWRLSARELQLIGL